MSDLDLRDLDAFVAIARTKNFRRAALGQRVFVSSLSERLRGMSANGESGNETGSFRAR
jgi:DNA-binding transcriptional LysR family regulator